MEWFLIILSSIIIVMLFLMLFYMNSLFNKEKLANQNLEDEISLLKRKLEQYKDNRAYRLYLVQPLICEYQIKKFDDKTIEVDKKAEGKIINISRSGMLFETNINFPVEKRDVLMEFNFTLDKVKFCLNGKLVRKEMRSKSANYYYGVEFEDVPNKVSRELSLCVNRMDIYQRQTNAS